eukprot:scaffold7033_cov257-Pinguiococcus_pyrenoidosus.AAC.21
MVECIGANALGRIPVSHILLNIRIDACDKYWIKSAVFAVFRVNSAQKGRKRRREWSAMAQSGLFKKGTARAEYWLRRVCVAGSVQSPVAQKRDFLRKTLQFLSLFRLCAAASSPLRKRL